MRTYIAHDELERGMYENPSNDMDGTIRAALEYIKQNMTVVSSSDSCHIKIYFKINRLELCMTIGIWDWVAKNCPNKRVVHLMCNHKSNRVRLKNFKRAGRMILRKEQT